MKTAFLFMTYEIKSPTESKGNCTAVAENFVPDVTGQLLQDWMKERIEFLKEKYKTDNVLVTNIKCIY